VGDAVASSDFILGDDFSAADIMMGYALMLAERFLPQLPDSVTPYWNRLKARRAYQQAVY
jgi:glutathione S-transferase